MATLKLSADAPQEDVTFGFGQELVELSPGGTFETEDQDIISNAKVHPWLEVEIDQVEVYVSKTAARLDPANDPMTQEGQIVNPNDPDEIRKAEEAKDSVPEGVVAAVDQQTGVVETESVHEEEAPSEGLSFTGFNTTTEGDNN
jgi:hypothetical protein